MLDQLEEIVISFGETLSQDNIEGLSYLLSQLASFAHTKGDLLQLDKILSKWTKQLQLVFSTSWEGKQLSRIALL